MRPLLEVEHLSLSFTQYDKNARRELTPVRDLSLRVSAGQVVAVIGASGSGKSLLAHCLLGILPENACYTGTLTYDGTPLTHERICALRGREIVLVPQGVTYLDPLMKVGQTLTGGKKERTARRDEALERYGLGLSAADLYPFELSGGMARRVLIGTAVMGAPRLLIADEPTPGLDDATARRILNHLRELAQAGCGVLLITHDVSLALTVADRICVLYDGHTVEELSAASLAAGKADHPYTRALWDALPENGFTALPQPGEKEESVLQADHVTFAYRHTAPVLQDFSFALSRGERVGLWGKSGRGKTTLCRLLAGWERPEQGSVLLDGQPITSYRGFSPVQLLRQHPEQSFDPLLTVGRSMELSHTDRRLFEPLGIREEWLRRYPAELSGGELQRLCIARALSGDVSYLLCDETGAMLDALTQAELWRVLLRQAEERKLGLLIVSHDRALLQRLCTRIETL